MIRRFLSDLAGGLILVWRQHLRDRRDRKARASWCVPAAERQRVAAAADQRWERQQRLATIDHQIAAAAERWHQSSGEVAAGPGNAAAVPPPPPGGSRTAIAAGSPDEPHGPDHRPDRIDAAAIRSAQFHQLRPRKDTT